MPIVLPVDIVERIGRHVDGLRSTGLWNEVFAFRHRGMPHAHEVVAPYALVVPMIAQSLMEGVYEAPDDIAYGIQDEHAMEDTQDMIRGRTAKTSTASLSPTLCYA